MKRSAIFEPSHFWQRRSGNFALEFDFTALGHWEVFCHSCHLRTAHCNEVKKWNQISKRSLLQIKSLNLRFLASIIKWAFFLFEQKRQLNDFMLERSKKKSMIKMCKDNEMIWMSNCQTQCFEIVKKGLVILQTKYFKKGWSLSTLSNWQWGNFSNVGVALRISALRTNQEAAMSDTWAAFVYIHFWHHLHTLTWNVVFNETYGNFDREVFGRLYVLFVCTYPVLRRLHIVPSPLFWHK